MDCIEQELQDLHFNGRQRFAALHSDNTTALFTDNTITLQHIEQAVRRDDKLALENMVLTAKPSIEAFWLFRNATSGIQLCEKALKANPSLLTQRDDNMQTLLHQAAKFCDLDVCCLLIKMGAEVDVRDISENTPLLVVVNENGKSYEKMTSALDVMKYLMAAGASVDAADAMGYTPFLKTVQYDNLRMASLLVEGGASILHTNQCSTTALMLSCCSCDSECFKYILKLDNCTKDFLNKRNDNGVTALHLAVCSASLEKTRMLLENGANVNLSGYLEWVDVLDAAVLLATESEFRTNSSVLWYAYMVQSVDIMKCLAEFGCNVSDITGNGISLLHQCAIDGNIEYAKVLLDLGANIDQLTENTPLSTPLSIAASEGYTDMVHFLLDSGSDVNKLIEDGRTAIFSALDYPDVVSLLIGHGADVNVTDVYGISVLACAVMCKCYDVVKLLLLHGADIHVSLPTTRMWMGEPSLLFAEVKRCPPNLPLLQLLLDHGIDVNLTNENGQTALMCLVRQKNASQQMVNTLLQFGADVSARDGLGRNVFFMDVHSKEALPIAVLLSEAGASCNCVDNKGNTPQEFAIRNHSICDLFALLKLNCKLKPIEQKLLRLAVLTEQYKMSIMLYLAGCDVNKINVWIKVDDNVQYRIPISNTKLLDFVKTITSCPPRLKLLCRTVVREHVPSRASLYLLPLPQIIQEYLDLADMEYLLI